jgi:hypothetical protein
MPFTVLAKSPVIRTDEPLGRAIGSDGQLSSHLVVVGYSLPFVTEFLSASLGLVTLVKASNQGLASSSRACKRRNGGLTGCVATLPRRVNSSLNRAWSHSTSGRSDIVLRVSSCS